MKAICSICGNEIKVDNFKEWRRDVLIIDNSLFCNNCQKEEEEILKAEERLTNKTRQGGNQ